MGEERLQPEELVVRLAVYHLPPADRPDQRMVELRPYPLRLELALLRDQGIHLPRPSVHVAVKVEQGVRLDILQGYLTPHAVRSYQRGSSSLFIMNGLHTFSGSLPPL